MAIFILFNNNNKKDHRLDNLHIGDHSSSTQGRSGARQVHTELSDFKGIVKHGNNRYSAHVQDQHYGGYDTPEKAALAYNIKALEVYGNIAVLNKLSAEFIRQYEDEVRDILINGPKKSSKYIGVSWQTHDKKWRATFQHNNIPILCKNFEIEIEAAAAYNIKAEKYPGKYKLNEGIPQEVIDRVKTTMEMPRKLTSKYLYISWHKDGNSYRYTLPPGKFKNDKKIPLSKSGFKTDKEAAIVCNQAIRDIRGDQSITTIVIDDDE